VTLRATAPAISAEPAEIDVNPLRVREMTSAERARLMARVLDDHPELADLVPERFRIVGK